MPIFYKVVSRESDGTRCSVQGLGKATCKVYEKGVAVRATVGGLLVFETLQLARRFLRSDIWFTPKEVWLCECSEPVELPSYRLSVPFLYLETARALWEDYRRDAYLDPTTVPWPPGTLAFRQVTLTRKVSTRV